MTTHTPVAGKLLGFVPCHPQHAQGRVQYHYSELTIKHICHLNIKQINAKFTSFTCWFALPWINLNLTDDRPSAN